MTIHESVSEDGTPQRRGGIHTDGFCSNRGNCLEDPWWHPWGGGRPGEFSGGIYSASNVSNSVCFWDVFVQPGTSSGFSQGNGDCEYLRSELGRFPCVKPLAGELYWFTDATPHESLPLLAGTRRQYFRLVTSDVAVWWEQHSTPNELGIQPNATILTHSKFDGKYDSI